MNNIPKPFAERILNLQVRHYEHKCKPVFRFILHNYLFVLIPFSLVPLFS